MRYFDEGIFFMDRSSFFPHRKLMSEKLSRNSLQENLYITK